MGHERRAGALTEPLPDKEDSSPLDLESFRTLASRDERLQELSEEILMAIETYVNAKRRHAAHLKDDIAKMREPERYKERSTKREVDRYSAHNELVAAVRSFAQHCQKIGFDTAWWDGPGGLAQESDNGTVRRTPRQRIDDWAMDIWLDEHPENT